MNVLRNICCLDVLGKDVDLIKMIRFLQQFETGKGDYTIEREKWLGNMTVNDVIEELAIYQDVD